jgi:RNA polymerase sigma factor (sigma-70 family)
MTIVPCKHAKEGGNFGCAQAGCSQCLEKLICANEGLIHACLQRQRIGGVAYADLEQEGRIALWRAVLKYDRQRGTAFSSYAWIAIRNQLWAAVRYANQSNLWVEGEAPWFSIAEIAERAYLETAIQAAIQATVSRLPERLRAVLVWVYGLDGQPPRTMGDLGREWSLTRERIRQLRNEALVLLRLPAYSAELRDLCDQDSRSAYRQALHLNRKWLARRRKS